MRRAHMLRENRANAVPTLVIAFDTETDPIPAGPGTTEARLRFGWAMVRRRHRGMQWTAPRWLRFTTPGDLWRFVDAETRVGWRTVLVAHNVGFDLRVTDGFRLLAEAGWELRGAVIDDPPTILRWRQGRRSLLVLDTLNYYRMPLREVGRTVGIDKLDMPPEWTGSEADDAYCRRDVEIVMAAFLGLVSRVRDLDLGNFAPTIPAMAFGAFRHRHLHTPVLIDDNPAALSIARASYFGGRTEAYRLGPIGSTVTVYDVNSLYPSVMLDTPVPTVLRGAYTRVRVSDIDTTDPGTAAVAEVTLETDSPDYPILHDGRLIFPIGTFRAVLPHPELVHAIERGRVVKVHRAAIYDAAILFASYVREWYQRRLDAIAAGDPTLASFCKLMMNSLYGKLGQRGETWEAIAPAEPSRVGRWLEVDHETGEVHHRRAFGGLVSERSAEVEARDSHPAIAATITSAARLRLLGLMDAVGRSSVVYVDTDSLFTLPTAPRAVLDGLTGSSLGMLKRERELSGLVIFGLKDYAANGLRRTKGVRQSARLIGPDTWLQETFEGLPGAVARGDLSRQLIRETVKHLARSYDKGRVTPGGRVVPYRFPLAASAASSAARRSASMSREV